MAALILEEMLTSCCYDLSDFVVALQKGFFEILENGVRSHVIFLVHVAFYISNLILIEMIKTDSRQDDFVTDNLVAMETEMPIFGVYRIHQINIFWNLFV